MKCDLHVHSRHSGMCQGRLLRHVCRESYNSPLEVYEVLKRRGMDLVTLTDHDSVEGGEDLRRYPDFFLSEEVTCRMPSGTSVHVGVYDLSERQHSEIQRRRDDLISLLIYLTERRIFFSINHVFSSLTGRRELQDFAWFETYFPAFETRNGHMLPYNNLQATRLARSAHKVSLAGSDAHTLRSLGTAYTVVPGTRDKTEFFAGLRAGRGLVQGEDGSYWKLTRDVFLIVREMLRENPKTALLAPLALFIPPTILANYCKEAGFGRWWWRQLRRNRNGARPLPLWAAEAAGTEVFL